MDLKLLKKLLKELNKRQGSNKDTEYEAEKFYMRVFRQDRVQDQKGVSFLLTPDNYDPLGFYMNQGKNKNAKGKLGSEFGGQNN